MPQESWELRILAADMLAFGGHEGARSTSDYDSGRCAVVLEDILTVFRYI